MYAAIFAHGVAEKELYGQRAGSSYGNHYGPSPGHTWAAEAVLLASLQVRNTFTAQISCTHTSPKCHVRMLGVCRL